MAADASLPTRALSDAHACALLRSSPPKMADASLLPRRIVKETQRLLSEPGVRPLRVVSAPLRGVIAVARHALDGTSLPPPRKLLLRSLFGTLVSRPRSLGLASARHQCDTVPGQPAILQRDHCWASIVSV